MQVAGYGRDIEASRRKARRLLREAGVPEGFGFELQNRTPPMPDEPVAIWLIDQWRRIGVNVTQTVHDVAVYFNNMRGGNYAVGFCNISDYAADPDLQLSWFVSTDKSPTTTGATRTRCSMTSTVVRARLPTRPSGGSS